MNIRNYINLVENSQKLPLKLYHGTTGEIARSILEFGMSSPSYWGSKSIASYYAEDAAVDGIEAAIISVPLKRFDLSKLGADLASMQEPIRGAISGKFRDLSKSDIAWQESFGTVESVLYTGEIVILPKDISFIPFEKSLMNVFQQQKFDDLLQKQRDGEISDEELRLLDFMKRTLKRDPWD